MPSWKRSDPPSSLEPLGDHQRPLCPLSEGGQTKPKAAPVPSLRLLRLFLIVGVLRGLAE
jgi:hypothetical protein